MPQGPSTAPLTTPITTTSPTHSCTHLPRHRQRNNEREQESAETGEMERNKGSSEADRTAATGIKGQACKVRPPFF
jgi:hypothetical protein